MPKYKVTVTCRESSTIVEAKDEELAREMGMDMLDENIEYSIEQLPD